MPHQSPRREERWGSWIILERNNNGKLPKFVKRYIFPGLRSWANPKQNKPKKLMPRHIVINLLKTEDKENLKEAREKWHLIYYRRLIYMSADFSLEIMKAKGKWYNIFSSPERREMSSSENSLNKCKWDKDILRWRKLRENLLARRFTENKNC